MLVYVLAPGVAARTRNYWLLAALMCCEALSATLLTISSSSVNDLARGANETGQTHVSSFLTSQVKDNSWLKLHSITT